MGQDTGCYFAGRSCKKLVKPLESFSLQSVQIGALNGTFVQGHVFELSAGAINNGDVLIIRVSNTNVLDIGDIYNESTPPDSASLESDIDAHGEYCQVTFNRSFDTLSFDFYIYSSETDDYIKLFQIIMQ